MAVSIFAPFGYVVFLFGSLYLFSKYHRRRRLVSNEDEEPWFPSHLERDIYFSLLSLPTAPPTQVLTAALIRRAMTDIQRIRSINESKQALAVLLQRGQIGDELWLRCQSVEKELDGEIREVMEEAETLVPGWGQNIFAQAQEMLNHERIKETFREIPGEREKEERKSKSRASTSYLPPALVTLTASIPVGSIPTPFTIGPDGKPLQLPPPPSQVITKPQINNTKPLTNGNVNTPTNPRKPSTASPKMLELPRVDTPDNLSDDGNRSPGPGSAKLENGTLLNVGAGHKKKTAGGNKKGKRKK